MKYLYLLFLVFLGCSSCFSSKLIKEDKSAETPYDQLDLIGSWKLITDKTDKINLRIEIDRDTLSFFATDKPVYSLSYFVTDSCIVVTNELNLNDSIQFHYHSRDTLILHLKEQGIWNPRKFQRLNLK